MSSKQVMDMITVNAARAARVADYGIAPGMRADLVVVGAPSVHEALAPAAAAAACVQGRPRGRTLTLTQELA